MALRRLVTADLAHHRIRAALTVAAIALAVSLVVSVTSGYASIESAVYKYLGEYLGSIDVEIFRANDPSLGMPGELLADLRRDPDVEKADGRYETSGVLTDINGEPGPKVAVIGVHRPQDKRSEYLKFESEGSRWFDVADGNEAVVDQAVADSLVPDGDDGQVTSLKVGDAFILPGADDAQLRFTIAGVVHKPALLAPFMQTIYVPLETLQRFVDKPGVVSRVMIDLRLGADDRAFAERWAPRLKAIDPSIETRLASDARREMEKNLQGVHALSYMGGTVSMLAAAFIIFSALSMGVTERQRTLAMLRAVVARKAQVGSLVLLEGVLLALLGAAIGVPLGWLWVNLLAWWYPGVFFGGVVPSWGGIVFGTLGSVVAALLAGFLPARAAMRVDPLEAMSPLSQPPSRLAPVGAFVAGLLLCSIDPLLLFGPVEPLFRAMGVAQADDIARTFIFFAHFGVGLPGVMVGSFLVAPMVVWICERVAGPVVAAMFGLRFAMLRQQLSTGVWRVAGTCAALMVGLAVLIVLQTSGNSMLKGWVLPNRFPDIFIMTSVLSGLNDEQQAKLESVPGIKPGEVMRIGIASPEYGKSFMGIARAALMPGATMFIAIEPDKAFDMMALEFREGSPQEAKRLLKQGDHVLVTEEYRQLKRLGVGDKLSLKTTGGERDFTVAAVIWSPGIDVMVAMFDMNRQFDQRTANSIFGSLEDGRKYFGIDQVYMFAANLEPGVEHAEILKRVERELGKSGMAAGDVRQIKAAIDNGLRDLLLLVSTVAFAAMAVSSLGVTNTILASIRTRRWQFGVLRSIGVTRGQLVRLVLAEAFLIGLVGCALGLATGFLMTVDAQALSRIITGYAPPMSVPWPIVFIGTGIVMTIAIAASLGPALSVARAEPLALLQAGRASA